jgi:hypothetical protein
LESPTAGDLGLVAVGLQEFINGMIPLGGIRSRGLGCCHLQDVKVAVVDFTNARSLKNYLATKNWAEAEAKPLGDFVEQQVTALLAA